MCTRNIISVTRAHGHADFWVCPRNLGQPMKSQSCVYLCAAQTSNTTKALARVTRSFLPTRGLGLGMRLEEVPAIICNASLMTTKSTKLSEEENRRLYGKCYHPNGHGHNYTGKLLNNQVVTFCMKTEWRKNL